VSRSLSRVERFEWPEEVLGDDTNGEGFKEGPEHQLWYYRSSVGILTERLPGAMTDELARVVDELGAEVARS
jgi:hypothetical protein